MSGAGVSDPCAQYFGNGPSATATGAAQAKPGAAVRVGGAAEMRMYVGIAVLGAALAVLTM